MYVLKMGKKKGSRFLLIARYRSEPFCCCVSFTPSAVIATTFTGTAPVCLAEVQLYLTDQRPNCLAAAIASRFILRGYLSTLGNVERISG